jgi:EpsD family peptidyl-prolyl cis-trans isomerase
MYPAHKSARSGAAALAAVSLPLVAVLLAGCGDKPAAPVATQTAAKVNKEEITVHQVNFLVSQQRGLRPDQAESASKQALERLVDQHLVVQRAEELKLERDPRVLQMLDLARREVLERAYLERVTEAAPRPSSEEMKQYFESKPNLFAQRKVYALQEIALQAAPDRLEAVGKKLQESRSSDQFLEWLRREGIQFAVNQAVRPAEQLPMAALDQLARMKDGEAYMEPTATGASVTIVTASRPDPVELKVAEPLIEQYLLNERKRKLIDDERRNLRTAAKVQYVGKFAQEGGSRPVVASSTPVAVAAAGAASAGMTSADIMKGMGIK